MGYCGRGGRIMFDWLTPQVIDTLIAVLQAVIILLVVLLSDVY